jgi:hypothetical protein
MRPTTDGWSRPVLLAALHAIVALNAVGGGLYGMAGAGGVPIGWLDGTPFTSYRVPSLILLGVGGLHGVASIAVWRGGPWARLLSLTAALVLLGWIIAQVVLIGYVSWLQPAVAGAAVINLRLAARLGRGA